MNLEEYLDRVKQDATFTSSKDADPGLFVAQAILEHYGVVIGSYLYSYHNGLKKGDRIEGADSSLIVSEGYTLAKANTLSLYKFVDYVNGEIEDVSEYDNAFYDVEVSLRKGSTSVLSIASEVQVAYKDNVYSMKIKYQSHVFTKPKDMVNRYSDLDYKDLPPSKVSTNISVPPIDLSDPKKVRKARTGKDPRFVGLDLNSLQLATQQKQDNTLIYNPSTTVKVSTAVKKKVDKLTDQGAGDLLDEIKRGWERIDPYPVYKATQDMMLKWFGNKVELVDSIRVMDDIFKASDLQREIDQLEQKKANTKTRSAASKIDAQITQLQSELDALIPNIPSQGLSFVSSLDKKKDEYEKDVAKNEAKWRASSASMDKFKSKIEQLESLRQRYGLSTPPILPTYERFLDTPTPEMVDIGDTDTPISVLTTAWKQKEALYRQALAAVNTVIEKNYTALYSAIGNSLALSKTGSLF